MAPNGRIASVQQRLAAVRRMSSRVHLKRLDLIRTKSCNYNGKGFLEKHRGYAADSTRHDCVPAAILSCIYHSGSRAAMSKRSHALPVGVLIAILTATPANAQSFDCGPYLKAGICPQKAICESRELRSLDKRMEETYRALMRQRPIELASKLYEKQRAPADRGRGQQCRAPSRRTSDPSTA